MNERMDEQTHRDAMNGTDRPGQRNELTANSVSKLLDKELLVLLRRLDSVMTLRRRMTKTTKRVMVMAMTI